MTEITDNLVSRAARSGLRIAVTALTWFVASVWLVHGLINKLVGGSPRHLLIVQSVPGLGGSIGHVVLMIVGAIEVLIAAWIVSGWRPRMCAATQTVLLMSMNVVELTWARQHLLWPAGLVPVNLVFLSLAWANALLRMEQGPADCNPQALRGGNAPVNPFYRLQRHPIAVRGWFDRSLVVTYAFPKRMLAKLLPPGLEVDGVGDWGFVAVAMVQTRGLRPIGLPRVLGRDFFLAGYRVFVKFRTPAGRTLRGLYILRSDADRRAMVWFGNLLTHYRYRKCESFVRASAKELEIAICTQRGEADVHVIADLAETATLPAESPFTDAHAARRFAGPLPFTFDYEPQTLSIVLIRGVRSNWSPRLVNVDVRQMNFFNRAEFASARPILASAFYVQDIPYRWERGVRVAIAEVKS